MTIDEILNLDIYEEKKYEKMIVVINKDTQKLKEIQKNPYNVIVMIEAIKNGFYYKSGEKVELKIDQIYDLGRVLMDINLDEKEKVDEKETIKETGEETLEEISKGKI